MEGYEQSGAPNSGGDPMGESDPGGDGGEDEQSGQPTSGAEGSASPDDTAQTGDGRSDEVDFSEEDPSSSSSSSSSSSGSPSMSDAERQAELEGTLNETMASYDGMILREREYVLNRGNEEGSEEALEETGPAGPDEELPYDEGDEDGSGGGAEASGPPGSESQSSGGGYRPSGPAQNRDGEYQHQGQTPPPADIPDGNDDDVVARQIREAAMRETDPVLKEKLWDEYRKYKNQSNG